MVAPMRRVGGRVVHQDVERAELLDASPQHMRRPGRARPRWRRRWRSGRPGVAATIAAAASSSPACLREDSITAAPASASDAAIARPMPFDAPVTSATLPSSSWPTSGSLARDDGKMSGVAAPDRVATAEPAHAPRLGYIPALDGLRALAVIAVLLYHGDQTWIPGGFLGVDVFFVISGYLITCLLLSDWQQTGGVGLKRFWYRRARRLLPALFTMLFVVSLYAILFLPDVLDQLRGEVIAALLYVENWFLIFRDLSYFQSAGRQPLLQHVWSLAVEEQYYLFWPLILMLVLTVWGKSRRALLIGVLAGVVISTLEMAILYHPYTDPSRVYYGTDTRVAALLLGVRARVRVGAVAADRQDRSQRGHRARRGRGARGRRAVLDVPQRRGVRSRPLPRRVPGGGDRVGAPHRGDRAPGVEARAVVARVRGVPLDRRALVRHLPLALADLHGHPAALRRADHRHPAARDPPDASRSWLRRSRTGTSRSRSATARSSADGRSSARPPARPDRSSPPRPVLVHRRDRRRVGDHRGRVWATAGRPVRRRACPSRRRSS